MSTYSNRLQPALQNLLQHIVRFFHPRSSCTTTHISADVQRITLNASCMMISGERTKQLDIFCRITDFTSDFLSFIDVELIRFFHGAIQLSKHFQQTLIFMAQYSLFVLKVPLIPNQPTIRTQKCSGACCLLIATFLTCFVVSQCCKLHFT